MHTYHFDYVVNIEPILVYDCLLQTWLKDPDEGISLLSAQMQEDIGIIE